MRIPIRIQLTGFVLLTSSICLAVIAISTWVVSHNFVVTVSSSRLALTASLKAATLTSNMNVMQTIAHGLSTRVLFQKTFQEYNQGDNSSSLWDQASADLSSALAGIQTGLALQAAAYSKSGRNVSQPLFKVSGPIEGQIKLPYTVDGHPVYLGDANGGYPPRLFPNFTHTVENGDSITFFDGQEIETNYTILLGPWQLNESFALVSLTTPVVNNTDKSRIMGWLTVVFDAQSLFDVTISPEGLGNSGTILLIGPNTPYNRYPGKDLYQNFPIPSPTEEIEDVPIRFILAPNTTNFYSRHSNRSWSSGNSTAGFSISSYPAVLEALTHNESTISNAGSLLNTNNEQGQSVSLGFSLVESSLCQWVLIVEQEHAEVWGPIDNFRNVLLGCIFGTLGGMLLISYPLAHFSSRPIRRLREATTNSIDPPSYPLLDDSSMKSHSPSPEYLNESANEKGQLNRGSMERGRPASRDPVVPAPRPAFQIPSRVKDRHHYIKDELTDLTKTFNEMSDELRLQYARLEERVQQRTAELVLSKKAAEAANESKTLFIANISHELKTPLNGILGMCAVCMQEDDPILLRRSLRSIYQSGDLLHNLLTDLLTFSKNQFGQQLVLDEKEFRLRDISTQISSIFSTQARESKVDLHIHYEECLDTAQISMTPATDGQIPADLGRLKDMWLWGDYQRILQVMINLISNSLKFTPAGGSVILRIKCLGETEEVVYKGKDQHVSETSRRAGSRSSRISKPRTPSDTGSSRSKIFSSKNADVSRINIRRKKAPIITSPDRSPSPPPVGRTLSFQFEVYDTGPGIPPHLQQSIFDPFVQGDLRLTKKFGGTGLGLSICTQLAELMHGSISLQSEVGVGSTFTLHIPLRHTRNRADSTASSYGGASQRNSTALEDTGLGQIALLGDVPSSPANKGPAVESGDSKPRLLGLSQPFFSTSSPPMSSPTGTSRTQKKVRVLVADDNKINQEVVLRMLRLEDIFDVHLAKDGQEALDMVKASKKSGQVYDLIFMDVQMPNLDGRESTRMIRQLGETAPIVALTAFADEVNQKECMDSGMDYFLAKPIRRPALKHVLNVYCAPIMEADEEASPDMLNIHKRNAPLTNGAMSGASSSTTSTAVGVNTADAKGKRRDQSPVSPFTTAA